MARVWTPRYERNAYSDKHRRLWRFNASGYQRAGSSSALSKYALGHTSLRMAFHARTHRRNSFDNVLRNSKQEDLASASRWKATLDRNSSVEYHRQHRLCKHALSLRTIIKLKLFPIRRPICMNGIDITEGKEPHRVLLQATDEARVAYANLIAAGFEYEPANLLSQSDIVSDNGCQCVDDCSIPCECLHFSENDVASESLEMECSELCACSPDTCTNRIVQGGIQRALLLKWTKRKGFALHAQTHIPKDTFICTYSGEIISYKQARERWAKIADHKGSNYILVIKEHFGDTIMKTSIDPSSRGNIGRFISASL